MSFYDYPYYPDESPSGVVIRGLVGRRINPAVSTSYSVSTAGVVTHSDTIYQSPTAAIVIDEAAGTFKLSRGSYVISYTGTLDSTASTTLSIKNTATGTTIPLSSFTLATSLSTSDMNTFSLLTTSTGTYTIVSSANPTTSLTGTLTIIKVA